MIKMGNMLLGVFTAIGKNLLAMVMTETMVLWLVDKYVDSTKALWDDHLRDIIKGAFKNDMDLVKQGISGLVAKYFTEEETAALVEIQGGVITRPTKKKDT